MALNHTQLQALKPKDKPYKKYDRDGLFINVLPTGKMTWRFRYSLNGKREVLTIGPYPAIGLAVARKRRDEAAALLATGVSPAKDKQENNLLKRLEAARATTFRALAERWFAEDVAHKSENWKYNITNWLKLDIYPVIGDKDPREITTDHIIKVMDRAISRNAPASANKLRAICAQVFEYAIDRNEVMANPVARVKTAKTPEAKSHRALTVKEIRPFLLALEAIDTRCINKIAVRLMMLTFTRKDELRLAKWEEFDLDNGIWDIPAHRMKMRDPHRVYLSRQALTLLAELKPLSHGSLFLFPNNSTLSKPIGHTTINSVIDRLDIQGARFVPHGFRATASSLLNEKGFRPDVIERQLAHKEQNKVRGIYNQAEYAVERREMLQWWADYLDTIESGRNVVAANFGRDIATRK